jgi:hypothetical protein
MDTLTIQYGTEVCNRFRGENCQELATTLTLRACKNYLLTPPDLSACGWKRKLESLWTVHPSVCCYKFGIVTVNHTRTKKLESKF